MKKLLVLMLVMVMASAASATVIDVIAVDIGQSGGRLGATPNDALEYSDTIGLKLVLNSNAYPNWPSYDGYLLSSMDLSLDVVGNGTLSCPVTTDKTGAIISYDLGEHDDWDFPGNPIVSDDGIDRLLYASIGGINAGSIDTVPQPQDIIWDMFLHCGGQGNVTIDLHAAAGEYADYSTPPQGGGQPYGGWKNLDNTKVGDLTIYQVPEPMTMVLLGLGGLFLRRRR